MLETWEKSGDDLAVTNIVNEQKLLKEESRQVARIARAQAALDIVRAKLTILNTD